jgi:Leucine-rich repeat (LRR) protein
LQPSWYLDEWDPLDPRPNTLTGQPPHDYTIPPSSSKVGQPESSRQRPLGSGFGGFGQLHSFYRFLENRVTGMKTLTKLVLKNIGFLQSLPIDFSQLRNLRHLDLSGCSKLTELPKTFSELLQLQYLALQDCFRLSIPLDILGEISTLEYVDFQGCAKLVCLPERIPYQRHLRYLNLLGTGLLQLPDNLGILDKLEQITIGSSALKQIPLTVANLKGLAELFLIECSGLQQILPEGIAAPNIKILAIDRCPIDNFSFQDQGILDVQNIHLRVGMSFLRDFILTNTSISQISIPDCVSPRLETIDLSGNIQLMHVNALPSALVSLNLQNCCGLKTLTSLSNLVNLKFLNINRCFNLKTLNMEGLASLEEIKAEECWELQRIQGLNQRERLNCVHISTDNTVIWNDICLLLVSICSSLHRNIPSYKNHRYFCAN